MVYSWILYQLTEYGIFFSIVDFVVVSKDLPFFNYYFLLSLPTVLSCQDPINGGVINGNIEWATLFDFGVSGT